MGLECKKYLIFKDLEFCKSAISIINYTMLVDGVFDIQSIWDVPHKVGSASDTFMGRYYILCPTRQYTKGVESLVEEETDLEPSEISEPLEGQIINMFCLHETNGKAYYHGLQAELYQDYLLGVITIAEIRGLEKHLDEVKNLVNTGDWISAKTEIESLETNEFFDQELKDRLISDANNYIIANY